MRRHYVTHFDKNYLVTGLGLYNSMKRWCNNYLLWIVCLDDETYDVLSKLKLESTQLISLKNIEDEELLKVKKSRTLTEYYWTLTPYVIQNVFKQSLEIDQVTYLDADLFFLDNPDPIFAEFELSKASILITEHAYSPEYDQSRKSGKYCVQFIVVNRISSDTVIQEWKEKCLEWCFNRFEQGKFGDQYYLNDWPKKYKNTVHVLTHKEWALAPWNANRFTFSEAIFYHFHQFKLVHSRFATLGSYNLPFPLIENVYLEYVKSLKLSAKRASILIPKKHTALLYIYFLIKKTFFYLFSKGKFNYIYLDQKINFKSLKK